MTVSSGATRLHARPWRRPGHGSLVAEATHESGQIKAVQCTAAHGGPLLLTHTARRWWRPDAWAGRGAWQHNRAAPSSRRDCHCDDTPPVYPY